MPTKSKNLAWTGISKRSFIAPAVLIFSFLTLDLGIGPEIEGLKLIIAVTLYLIALWGRNALAILRNADNDTPK